MASRSYLDQHEIIGVARGIDVLSTVLQWRMLMDQADGFLKASVNGGAYFPIMGVFGPVVTMQQTYDGGGAVGSGLGRSVVTMNGGAVVFSNSGANNNNVLELTKDPGGAQSGGCLSCIVGANATNTAFAAKFDFRGTAGTVAGNGIVNIEAGAATILAGPLTGLEMDLTTNFTPGANNVTGLRILIPAHSAASNANEGAINIQSQATAGRILALRTRGETGRQIALGYDVATTLSGTIFGFDLNLSANVTPGANPIIPLFIGTAATTAPNANSSASGIAIDSNATTMRVLDIDVANTNSTISIIRYGLATVLAGAIAGLVLDLTTNVTPGVQPVTGMRIAVPATTAGAAIGQAALVIDSDATSARVLDIDIANTSTNTAAVMLTYGSATVLSGTVIGMQINLTTNVTPGANILRGLAVEIGATTASNSAAQSAISVNSDATAQRILDLDVANESAGTGMVCLRYGNATVLTGAITGYDINLNTNVTPGANAITGIRITMPATTAGASNSRAAIQIESNATNAASLNIRCSNVGNTIISLDYFTAAVLTGTTIGFDMNLTTSVTPGAQPVIGLRIQTPATTAGGGAGQAALVINSDAVTARAVDIDIANTSTSVAAVMLRYGSATVLTGTVIGMQLDLNANVTPGANILRGLAIEIGATTASNSAAQAAISVNSDATAQRIIDLDAANTSATTGMVCLRYGSAAVLAAALRGYEIDLTTNVTPGANAITGIRIQTAATTRASTAGEGALVINSDATTARVMDIDAANTSGTVIIQRFGSATTLAGGVIACDIDCLTNITPGANGITGIRIRTAATTKAETSGEGALAILSSGTQARVLDIAGSNTTGTMAHLHFQPSPTLTGSIIGMHIDLLNSVTPGAEQMTGLKISIDNTTAAGATTAGALVISSTATTQRCLDIGAGNQSSLIAVIHFSPGGVTLQGATVGLDIDLLNAVTPLANAVTGLRIQIDNTTAASAAGEGALVINSDATAARVLDIDVANTSGTIAVVRYGAAATLAGAIIGLDIDLTTNVTSGTNAVTGIRIQTDNTTRASTAGEGALVINSDATAARVLDIDIANTTGTPIICRYGAATTPAPVTMMTLDLSTNVTSNANANIGLDIPIVAADEDTTAPMRMNTMRVFVGTGAPNNANGSNGDEYHRIDGGVATSLYKKIAGAWTGIA